MRYQPSVEKNGLLFVDIDSLQLTEQDITQLHMFQNKEIVVFEEKNYNEINFSINCEIETSSFVDTNPEFEQVLRSFAQRLNDKGLSGDESHMVAANPRACYALVFGNEG